MFFLHYIQLLHFSKFSKVVISKYDDISVHINFLCLSIWPKNDTSIVSMPSVKVPYIILDSPVVLSTAAACILVYAVSLLHPALLSYFSWPSWGLCILARLNLLRFSSWPFHFSFQVVTVTCLEASRLIRPAAGPLQRRWTGENQLMNSSGRLSVWLPLQLLTHSLGHAAWPGAFSGWVLRHLWPQS